MALLLALAALIVVVLALRAARRSRQARRALMGASLSGELVSIDTARGDLGDLRQENIVSTRYGISGRPDRIVKTTTGIIPVELKSGKAPLGGPHKAQVAQLAVYCLLIEDQFQTTVTEGIIEYSDRSITVSFDSRMKKWILALIEEVQEAKQQDAKPRRSHNHVGRCRACGFRQSCDEALR
jgi:CRISPR-associated exonuclease Cas4